MFYNSVEMLKSVSFYINIIISLIAYTVASIIEIIHLFKYFTFSLYRFFL